MAARDEATVGERIAYYRKRRGITQSVLSGLLGRSEEWLGQIERGSRPVDRLTTIVDVARALRIEPTLLLPAPFFAKPRRLGAPATSGSASSGSASSGSTSGGATIGTAPDCVPAIRAAMMKQTTGLPAAPDPDDAPVSLATLSRAVERAFGYSQTERWSDLGPLLPELIAAAHRAVAADETPDSLALLSLTYRVASGMLDRIGEPHLPWIAAERSSAAAERSGDPLVIAGAAWRWAVVLRHAGELADSHDVPMAAAEQLARAAGGLQQADPRTLSVYGSLLLKGAVAAASQNDRRAVRDYLTMAETVAERTGEANHFWFAFGPTNVAIHRVWLDLELGDPVAAIEAADAVDTSALPAHLAERRVSHLITVAWANYLRRRDDDAVHALLAAQRHAPEQLLFTRRVDDMLSGMLRRDRRNRRDLRQLAEFAGAR